MRITLAVLWALLAARGWSADSNAPPSTTDELATRIDAVPKQYGVPGMVGAIVDKDAVIWVGGVGVADLQTQRPADANSLFRVGSISKSFIGLAALILVERHQLSLDSPIDEWVPEAGVVNPWSATDPVLLKHTMEHTAGFDVAARPLDPVTLMCLSIDRDPIRLSDGNDALRARERTTAQ